MNKPNPLCSLHLPAGMVPECLGLTSPEGRLPAPPAQIPADRACSPLPFGRSAPAWRQRKSALPSSPPAASAQRHANSALGRGAGTCRTASSRALDARPRQGMLAPPAQGLHEARPQASRFRAGSSFQRKGERAKGSLTLEDGTASGAQAAACQPAQRRSAARGCEPVPGSLQSPAPEPAAACLNGKTGHSASLSPGACGAWIVAPFDGAGTGTCPRILPPESAPSSSPSPSSKPAAIILKYRFMSLQGISASSPPSGMDS